MLWYEQTAEENNIILGNAQDDFLLLKHHYGGSRAKRVIPSFRDKESSGYAIGHFLSAYSLCLTNWESGYYWLK
jgi:hypothetical protein